ncbi:CENP-B homolog protein 2-like [Rhizophagus clarus]|uniref:CENP-B homolog protein 2-like n=1 Tax=Rhizophagus clarus TaxID=94130 RepID=A0A8H3QGA1_9GLOM|nr:CENP-B homolog protein 2-like [Rhizophagus clarus]
MLKTQNTKILRTQIAIDKGKISQEKILSKRASLSLAQKHEICLKKATEPSIKNKELAKLFDVSEGCISNTLKNSQKWLEINPQAPEAKGKRQVKAIFPEIEEALTLWQGEAASAPLKKLDEFREELQDLIRGYSLDDVFNCDETGLYWKIEPKRTISNKPLDATMKLKGRKILLLVDNAPVHALYEGVKLTNIEIKFLPPNTTTHLQPCDKGIINSFKAHYQKLLLQNRIKAFDFQQEIGNNDTDSQDGIEENEHEEMEENERSEIQGLIDKLEYTYPLTAEEYIRIDQENEIDGETPTEEQIVAILKENNSISDNESDREITLISSSEVLAAFDKIFIYLEQNNNQNIIDKSAFKAMKKARREVYRNNFFLKKQMGLDLFVKSNNSIDGIGNMNREGVKDNIIDVDNINFETLYFNERDIYNHEEEYEGFIEYQIDQDSLYK